jgi:hypothetical protein
MRILLTYFSLLLVQCYFSQKQIFSLFLENISVKRLKGFNRKTRYPRSQILDDLDMLGCYIIPEHLKNIPQIT